MVLKFMRVLFLLLCMVTGGILGGMYADNIKDAIIRLASVGVPKSGNVEVNPPVKPPGKPDEPVAPTTTATGPLVTFGCVIAGVLLGLVMGTESLRLLGVAGRRMEEMEPEETLATVGGIVLGLIITSVFIPVLTRAGPIFPVLLLLAGIVFIYLGLIATNRLVDFFPMGGAKGSVRRKAIKILDTNVIIDGRIAEICRTGFLEGNVYIPRFVLEELQLIADSNDQLRRARGRRGLEILNAMQKEFQLEVGQQDRVAPDNGEGVDARLVKLAKAIGGDIVTNDYNLNKVAELQGIKVLNVNDLALALKPTVLPGEEMTVLIIREGKEANQGIAYLDDGTMVVVEGGRKHPNETVDVMVTSVLQTTAGKMIFADIREPGEGDDENSIDHSLRAFTRGRSRRPLR